MFCIIPLLLIVSNAQAFSKPEKPYYDLAHAMDYFTEFLDNYGKRYETKEEYSVRFEIFKDHLEQINHLNEIYDATYGITRFSDLTTEEFASTRLGVFPTLLNETDNVKVPIKWVLNAPDSLDYRTENLVTEVKNQGNCGSCYIFSAIGNVEGQYAKKNGELVRLSEQEAVDCGTNGCRGGWPVQVMNALAEYGGSILESDYPYEGAQGSCRADSKRVKARVVGGQQIDTASEEELKGALMQYGPLSVCLHVNTAAFMHYKGGVMSPANCFEDGESINHCVLGVGYGTDAATGLRYWIIKNSWGAGWGEHGYFRLEVNKCALGESGTANAMLG